MFPTDFSDSYGFEKEVVPLFMEKQEMGRNDLQLCSGNGHF